MILQGSIRLILSSFLFIFNDSLLYYIQHKNHALAVCITCQTLNLPWIVSVPAALYLPDCSSAASNCSRLFKAVSPGTRFVSIPLPCFASLNASIHAPLHFFPSYIFYLCVSSFFYQFTQPSLACLFMYGLAFSHQCQSKHTHTLPDIFLILNCRCYCTNVEFCISQQMTKTVATAVVATAVVITACLVTALLALEVICCSIKGV